MSRASVTASRRFVLIRSPNRFGIRAGRPPCNRDREPEAGGKARIRRPSFKADVSRSDRSANLLNVRSIGSGLFSNREEPDLPGPPSFAIATACLSGDVKATKLRYTFHGPPSVHEARLGPPHNPRSYLHEGRATGSAREHDV